jgi:PAS domain S-box-containing protein
MMSISACVCVFISAGLGPVNLAGLRQTPAPFLFDDYPHLIIFLVLLQSISNLLILILALILINRLKALRQQRARALEQNRAVNEQMELVKRNESRLELAVSAAGLGVWEFHVPSGNLVIDERLAEMLGYFRDETGTHTTWWDKRIHPEDLPLVEEAWEAHLHGQTPFYEQEYRLRSKTDAWVWVLDRGKVVEWDDTGRPVRLSGTYLDITQRKQAEEAAWQTYNELERRVNELFTLNLMAQTVALVTHLRTALDMVARTITGLFNVRGAAISLLNAEQDALTVYAHFEHDRIAPEIVGRVFQLTDQPLAMQALKKRETIVVFQAQTNPITQSVAGFMQADTIECLMAVPLRAHGIIIGVITIASSEAGRDFTPAEVALAETVAGQIASAVEIARLLERERLLRQTAQSQNKELDAFAHTVAHDLKAPLGYIISYSDYLTAYADEVTLSEALEIVDRIKRAGLKAVNITNELLILAGVRKQAVSMSALNMAEIVTQALQSLEPTIEEYHGEITLPQDWPVAQGYAPWVEEVWINFISNGLKYGARPPRLELGGSPQADGLVRFWVRDNGDGITAEAQALLFTEFTRLSELRVKGHGLGLSIVRRIVEKLGGQVGVESTGIPGQGSVFYFTLPGNGLSTNGVESDSERV